MIYELLTNIVDSNPECLQVALLHKNFEEVLLLFRLGPREFGSFRATEFVRVLEAHQLVVDYFVASAVKLLVALGALAGGDAHVGQLLATHHAQLLVRQCAIPV